MSSTFTVSLVGRVNVGKSSLINTIAGQRRSITGRMPGITRDRVAISSSWHGKTFTLVDTAGLIADPETDLEKNVQDQTAIALKQSDMILFIVDVTSGIMQEDRIIAKTLLASRVPILLVANKADGPRLRTNAYEFYQLGFEEVFPVSSASGLGLGDLLDAVTSKMPASAGHEDEPAHIPHVAFIGKPNTGKSTLLNALIGSERSVVSSVPGTTRDVIDIILKHGGQAYLLLDTAGIRRQSRIHASVEYFSVRKSFETMRRADVVLLLIDITEGITRQDLALTRQAVKLGKSILIVGNKIDAAEKSVLDRISRNLRGKFQFVDWAPFLLISAKRKEGLDVLLKKIDEVYRNRFTRVAPETLSTILEELVVDMGEAARRLHAIEQTSRVPASFTVTYASKKPIPGFLLHAVEKAIRERAALHGIPLSINLIKV